MADMFRIPDTDIVVEDGQSVAIVGPGASGKSAMASRIASFYPSSAKYIAFQDSYGFASDRAYYLQQRWNSTEMDEDSPTGRALLQRLVDGAANPLLMAPEEAAQKKARIQQRLDELIALFGIDGILDKDPVTYSSGEIRKYQLVKSLLNKPSILVIDNPFIGLDPKTRAMLAGLFEGLSRELSLVLVLSRPEEIPLFITHAIVMPTASARQSGTTGTAGILKTAGTTETAETPGTAKTPETPRKMPLGEYLDSIFGPEVISFNDVSIRYGTRTILKSLNWSVRRGEHWALTGDNGSGKSTLLSLVCADNPMAYACDIHLFGRRRGSGESIWEIKKRIGYVSPEMHRAYKAQQNVEDVVASGFFDTTGLLNRPSPEQRRKAGQWMELFGIAGLAGTPFNRISGTQQRLTLVCRAFVKEPELLILDEPLHGLDNPSRFKVRDIIDNYCRQDAGRTLIMVTHYPEEYPSCIDHSLTLVKN